MDLATRILIVDDDDGIRKLISSFLEKNGFLTSVASDPVAMRASMAKQRPDLIVLDVMMPGEDGLTALRGLQAPGAPPVIMLSAVGSDIDRIIGLEIGAEDYLAKPCNPRELLARIRTVLRRRGRETETASTAASVPTAMTIVAEPIGEGRPLLRFNQWSLDPEGFSLYAPDGATVPLTEGEFQIMRALVEHPRRVLTRDQLIEYARGGDSDSFDRAVDVQVSRIRRKLAAKDGQELIRTVRNEGYMFTASVVRR
ncbi:response regulator [Sphingomonas carotinifaciens]|nr:response regulator transcription factor [Sphingomonas carotinifaciens]MBB4086950.1 two-component system OmpR family response regulator [Sphingomonas carotinifaciens]